MQSEGTLPLKTESGLRRIHLSLLTALNLTLAAVGLVVYGITRFTGLTQFPIYFFTDEAIHVTQAQELLQRGFHDFTGTFLPPYFLNDRQWNLSLSVYIHLISSTLFGKSVFITRATSVVVGFLGVIAILLVLKLVFHNRFWWAGALVMAIIPTWFLHSRTAFETVMWVSFYACFLCAYLLYRYRSPNYIFAALLFGAATFYSYASGPGLMGLTGLLLLLSDLRYHLRQRRSLMLGVVVMLILLAAPFIRFHFLHPDALQTQLQTRYSYWLKDIPVAEKLKTFGETYLYGFSPQYWFVPNDKDLPRHRMKDMGNLPMLLLPWIVLGLVTCLRHWRSSAHRAVWIALLAIPFSAAVTQIVITRVLAMVVPATLLACIGFDQVFGWIQKRAPYVYAPVAVGCAALLTVLSFTVMNTALAAGPTWYSDYGLGGMQYGAQQVFSAIPQELAQSPDTRIVLSPTWANNPNVFLFFFLTEPQRNRIEMNNIDAYLTTKRDLSPNQVFVMPPDEYQRAQESHKFVMQPPDPIIPYPNGQPGFYFVRLRYVDNIDAIFAADREARRQLKQDTATIAGRQITIRHSELDMGQVSDLFDGKPDTMIRGAEANPFVIEFNFPTPQIMSSFSITVGTMDFDYKVEATPANGGPSFVFQTTYKNLPPDPRIDTKISDTPQPISKLHIEMFNLHSGETANIHVRDFAFH